MQVKNLLLFTAVTLAALDVRAAKRALVMGGSCELEKKDGGSKNMFHEDLSRVSKSLKKRGWDVGLFYSGDHARCSDSGDPKKCPKGKDAKSWSAESLTKKAGLEPAAVKTNTKEEIFASLEAEIKLAEAAKASGAKAPYQVFLQINTHGGPETKKEGHTICLSGTDGSDHKLLPVAELRPYLQRLKDAGAKVALHDSSCYSGGSVKALGDLGCVVSNQSSNRPSWSSDIGGSTEGNLRKFLESGQDFNMEDLFLKGTLDDPLDNGDIYHQPAISGFPEGNQSGDYLIGILSPPKEDFVTGIQMEDAEKNRCEQVYQGLDEIQKFAETTLGPLEDDWMRERVKSAKGSSVPAPKDLKDEITEQLADYKKYYGEYVKMQEKEKKIMADLDTIKVDIDAGPLESKCKDDDCRSFWGIFLNSKEYGSEKGNKHIRLKGNELLALMGGDAVSMSATAGPDMVAAIRGGLAKDEDTKERLDDLGGQLKAVQKEKETSIEREEANKGSRGFLGIGFLDGILSLKAKLNRNIATARAYAFVAKRAKKEIPSDCYDFKF